MSNSAVVSRNRLTDSLLRDYRVSLGFNFMEKLQMERATVTFPYNSKRLQLYQVRQIAGALDFPTTASGSDLLVMECGKLCDDNYDLPVFK